MGNEMVMYLSGKEENKLYKNQNIGFVISSCPTGRLMTPKK